MQLFQPRPQAFQLPPAHAALFGDPVEALGEHVEFAVPGNNLTSTPGRASCQGLPTKARASSRPLPRPANPESRQLQPNDRCVRHNLRTAVLGKQRQRLRPVGLLVQHLDRPPPSQFLRVVDLAEMENVLLNDPPASNTFVLDDAPIAMPPSFFRILARRNMTTRHCSQTPRRGIALVGTTAVFARSAA